MNFTGGQKKLLTRQRDSTFLTRVQIRCFTKDLFLFRPKWTFSSANPYPFKKHDRRHVISSVWNVKKICCDLLMYNRKKQKVLHSKKVEVESKADGVCPGEGRGL